MAFSTALIEKRDAMREELNTLTAIENATPEDVDKAKALDAELEILEAKAADARALEDAQAERKKQDKTPVRTIQTGGSSDPNFDYERLYGYLQKSPEKTWFDEFVNSPTFKAAATNRDFRNIQVEAPANMMLFPGRGDLFRKAAGDPVLSTTFGPKMTDLTVVPHFWQPTNILPLVNVVNIPVPGLRYYQATMPVAVNATDFIAEAAAKPEIQPRWAPIDAVAETIANWTTVTLQALDDLPSLRAAIDFDLRSALEVKLDYYLLNGDGATPHIKGILNFTGIQNVAFVTATSGPDMIAKGIQAIAASGAGMPNAIVMNPADWWAIRVSKAATTGVYYFGPPTDQGVSNIFGIPVIQDANLAAGVTLVGDFRYATFYQRLGLTFIVGLKNDDIIKNQQTIVCEMRGFLAVTRPQAFATVHLV